MKNNLPLRMMIVMMVITAISGMVLSGIWAISKDKIAQNEKAKIREALYEINPETKTYKVINVGADEVYKCYNKGNSLIAYFFLAEGNGFQAPIKIAMSVKPDFKNIIGIRVLEQTETPGLGAKITEMDFVNKFVGLKLFENLLIKCKKEKAQKNKSEIKAITGATISSKACVSIINDKIALLRYLINGGLAE
ncbi:FMN-binding protein [Candidatus Margulisiibacteriota bacterium]